MIMMFGRLFRHHSRGEITSLYNVFNGVRSNDSIIRGTQSFSKSPTLAADKFELGDDPRKKNTASNVSNPDISKSANSIPKKKSSEAGFTISIDKSGLMKTGSRWPTQIELNSIEKNKEAATPLVKYLRSIIQVRGPMSVHDYMSQVG
jgi:hypothetical protein